MGNVFQPSNPCPTRFPMNTLMKVKAPMFLMFCFKKETPK